MIENMTLRVPSLTEAMAAYHALGYEDAGESIAATIALSDPALEGLPHHSIVMSEDPFQTLTMVEWQGEVPTPFAVPGWSAMEVLVKDLDALFEQLPAAFAVLNPPAALSFSDQIRAMQVAGPAGELIYFTEVSGEVPGFALPTPTRQVNQCFVMINAVTDIQRSIAFYAGEKPELAETKRRREKQIEHNKTNKIIPKTIIKSIPEQVAELDEIKNKSKTDLNKQKIEMEMKMKTYAEDLDFENAIQCRDKIKRIERELDKDDSK